MIHPIEITDSKDIPLDAMDGEKGETPRKSISYPSGVVFSPSLIFVLYGSLFSLSILGVHWKDKFIHPRRNATWLVFFGIILSINLVQWCLYLYHKFLGNKMTTPDKYNSNSPHNSSWYQDYFVYISASSYTFLHLLACARLIQRNTVSECPEGTECSYDGWRHNPLLEYGIVSYDSILLCMLMPIVQLTIAGHFAFLSALVCWVVAIGTIIVVMIINDNVECIPYLLAYIVGCVMIATELRKYSVHQSLLQKEMAKAMQQSEEEADKANAIEMRHMIANVAHDLKTVSVCPLHVCLC